MLDARPIVLICGILLSMLGAAMIVPVLVDLSYGHVDWVGFVSSAAFTFFVGTVLVLSNWRTVTGVTVQQAFILTTLVWLLLPAFAALPFVLGDARLSYTDAFFEAMSGLTTTGATIMTGLDTAAPGTLIWRAILQWFGGIGIIVMAVAVLPMLQVGGMQIFRLESSDTSDKAMPRVAQMASRIGYLYLGFTALCAAAYWACGMTGFEAIAHSMTTIATGGFSTSDGSIGHFDSAAVETVAIVFMIAGSLPFLPYIQMLARGRVTPVTEDPQVRAFFLLISGFIAALVAHQVLINGAEPLAALRQVTFNAVSIMTGTGYATTDYSLWGGFAVALFFMITFVGGCAGSTSCGMKVFRFLIVYANVRAQLQRLAYPNGVFEPRYGGRVVAPEVSSSVMSFFFLFLLSFSVVAFALSLLGLDTVTALSGAATAMANVGPGLGQTIGPAGTFQELPDAAKWVLCAGMLLGRLELFTVLVLLSPRFWRSWG